MCKCMMGICTISFVPRQYQYINQQSYSVPIYGKKSLTKSEVKLVFIVKLYLIFNIQIFSIEHHQAIVCFPCTVCIVQIDFCSNFWLICDKEIDLIKNTKM